MAVLKRYVCSKHGEFDAWSDGVRCPALKCRCKPREMVSAPAVHTSGVAKKADRQLDLLAKDFQMSNIKSTKEGDHQSGYFTRNNTTKNPTGVMWGNQGRFALDQIVKSGASTPVLDEPVGVKVTGGTAPKLRPSWVTKDHENLQIEK